MRACRRRAGVPAARNEPAAHDALRRHPAHPPHPEMPASAGLDGGLQGSRWPPEGSFAAGAALRHVHDAGAGWTADPGLSSPVSCPVTRPRGARARGGGDRVPRGGCVVGRRWRHAIRRRDRFLACAASPGRWTVIASQSSLPHQGGPNDGDRFGRRTRVCGGCARIPLRCDARCRNRAEPNPFGGRGAGSRRTV